jgi:hypothetical protein
MAYIAAADFRERTVASYCAGLILGETDGLDAYIDLLIAQVTTQVELDLGDDFEPAPGDADETVQCDGSGRLRLYTPRRVRTLTSVNFRALDGTLTLQATSRYRLHNSLNMAGSAMLDGVRLDYLEHLYEVWPLGTQTVQLVGKFGWAVVPTDIKRLVALKVYSLIRGSGDPLSTIVQRTTADAILTYGASTEVLEIEARYRRTLPVYVG